MQNLIYKHCLPCCSELLHSDMDSTAFKNIFWVLLLYIAMQCGREPPENHTVRYQQQNWRAIVRYQQQDWRAMVRYQQQDWRAIV